MPSDYLLGGQPGEIERLTIQARLFEPAAERMLDAIGPISGAKALDLGCGAMGIVPVLSRRVGPRGHVTGFDFDEKLLAAARAVAEAETLSNVDFVRGDAYATGLPRASFDLVHARFMLAPLGRDEALLDEMLALARPGGVIASQEPDAASLMTSPRSAAFDELSDAFRRAFVASGGDFDAGRQIFGLLRRRGLEDVSVRGEVAVLAHPHPYRRLPILFATSLRERVVRGGILAPERFDSLVAECERVAADPDATVTTFMVIQAWGRKPQR